MDYYQTIIAQRTPSIGKSKIQMSQQKQSATDLESQGLHMLKNHT